MRAAAPFILPFLLILGFGFGIMAILIGFRRRLDGWRVGRYLAVPGLIGAILVVAQIVRFPDESAQLVPRMLRGALVAGEWLGIDAAWSVPIGVGLFLAGVLAADTLLVALPAYAATAWRWLRRSSEGDDGARGRTPTDIVRAVLGVATAAVLLAASGATADLLTSEAHGGIIVAATYDLPGTPTSVVAVDERTGYLSFAEGQIARFTLPAVDGGAISVVTVADGLTFPRGLAVLDGELFVIDLGPLPCSPPYPQCGGADATAQLQILEQSNGRIVKYPIRADGSLGDPDAIVTGIPLGSTVNAPGSITADPNGGLLITIGNFDDAIAPTPERLGEITHPNLDLLGTVAHFQPDGSDLKPVITGLRNIYQVAFDPDGRLYGVDNGGLTARDYLGEEVLWLQDGLNYGFPQGGTFGQDRDPTARPLMLLPSGGSAGLAWAPGLGLDPGLLIGTSDQIVFIPISVDSTGPYVAQEHPLRVLLDGINGFVVSLQPTPDGRMLAAVFAGYSGLRNQLLVLERE
jgi:hypothetical protein